MLYSSKNNLIKYKTTIIIVSTLFLFSNQFALAHTEYHIDTGAASQGLNKDLTYTTNFPDPLTSPTLNTNKYSIYATYSQATSSPPVSTTTLQDLTYAYDKAGNITTLSDTSQTHSAKTSNYSYDNLYRLTRASTTNASYGSNYLETYSYNAIGNILNKSDIGNYSYTDSGYSNPHAATTIGTSTITYDNNGNQTNDGIWTNAWDYNNRLINSSKGTSTATTTLSTYIYDDSLATGWSTSWSWSTTVTTNSTEKVYAGTYAVKAIYNQQWGGLYFHKTSAVDLTNRDTLSFAVNGGSTGGQHPEIELFNTSDQGIGTVEMNNYIPGGSIAANTWYMVNIPLSAFNCATTSVGGVAIMNDMTNTMHFDEVRFKKDTAGSGSSTIISYGYDHEGNRVTYAVNGKATTTTANSFYEMAGATSTKYIYANGELIANVIADGRATSTCFVHTDHLTGSNVVTDSSGTLTELLDYYPFGKIRLDEKSGNFNERKKFTGHIFDADTGLNYMNARYQTGAQGRFISIDPMSLIPNPKLLSEPQRLNSYCYVRNNPLKYIDPTGMLDAATGKIEKGDTPKSITQSVNDRWGTHYTWLDIVTLNPGQLQGTRFEDTIGRSIIPNVSVPDITVDLSIKMDTYSNDKGINNPFYFRSKFTNFGDWDLKSKSDTVYYSKNDKKGYVFNGIRIDKDAPGNILFGYVGEAALWTTPTILHFFAGRNQVKSNNSQWEWQGAPYYGDDPRDYRAIEYGRYLNQTDFTYRLKIE
jgi:RHS repeat-associated protein